MARIKRRPQFKADLEAAYTYLLDRNPQAAEKFLRDLQIRFEALADYPKMGRARLANHPAARIFPYKKFVILYQEYPDNAGVELVRLFGPLQDWEEEALAEFDNTTSETD
ncbi:MAG: type II toxin-antitoxin system RelE/ParE family toxin [Pseudomonadota bacterium]